MPLKPKHQLGGSRPSAVRQFTDREGFITVFDQALTDKQAKPREHRVLVIYGVGGIGKTRIRKELMHRLHQQRPELLIAALDFTTEQYRNASDALAALRQSLHQDHGVDFRTFDIAFAVWWKKANPTVALRTSSIPFIDEGSLAAQVLAAVAQLPVVSWVPAIARVALKGEQAMVEWWSKRGEQELAALSDMEPADILERLPAFWAADMKEHLQRTETGVVLFLDTYEALTGKERAEGAQFSRDAWVRELVTHLPEALWVICGREELRWGEADAAWRECLSQHLVDGLVPADSDRFLISCGINDPAVRQAIVAGSQGVPFYLDLAVDTHEEIAAAGGEPEPQDFAATQYDLFRRFLSHLNDTEVETLKVLAVPRFWDRVLFEMLVAAEKTGYPVTAFARLCRFSFVNESEPAGIWTMHQLMRESMQEYTDKELVERVHRRLFDHYARQLSELDIKDITPAQKTALSEAFFHGRALLKAQELSDWFRKPAQQFIDAAQWQAALPLYVQLSNVIEKELGPEHPELATCLSNLASLFQATNRLAEAEPLMRRALAIDEKNYGKDHPKVALDLNNLASLLQATNRLAEAEPLKRRALAIDEQSYGKDHPKVALDLNNLASLLLATNRLAEAEPLMRRTLAIDEQNYGKDHPDVAIGLNNLAQLLKATNRPAEAEPLMRRGLAIEERIRGENHPFVALQLNNLASLLRTTNRLAEAEPLMRRALAIDEQSYGKDHPNVARDLNNLAQLFKATNRLAEAEPLMRRALAIDECSYGRDHPRVAICLNNLASLLQSTNRLAEAEPLSRRHIEILQRFTRASGHPHPHLQAAVDNYAGLLRAMGRSEDEIRKALTELAQRFGVDLGGMVG